MYRDLCSVLVHLFSLRDKLSFEVTKVKRLWILSDLVNNLKETSKIGSQDRLISDTSLVKDCKCSETLQPFCFPSPVSLVCHLQSRWKIQYSECGQWRWCCIIGRQRRLGITGSGCGQLYLSDNPRQSEPRALVISMWRKCADCFGEVWRRRLWRLDQLYCPSAATKHLLNYMQPSRQNYRLGDRLSADNL